MRKTGIGKKMSVNQVDEVMLLDALDQKKKILDKTG